jgi:RNA polymerase sigma factor (sigma-70 family)
VTESAETNRELAELQPALTRFFAARIADRTIREDLIGRVNLRVVERLRGQHEIEGVVPFGLGVARNVLHEHWREQKRRRTSEASLNSAVQNLGAELSTTIETGPHTRKALLAALHECVSGLSESDRVIAERCYGDGKSKNNREHLAVELGVTRNALDARISRLRIRLEACVKKKL